MKTPLQQKNKGFVILFAILISGTLLLISTGIFHVIQKELVLSSYARESQRAFYAADSALECALYADLRGIGTTNPITPFPTNPEGNQEHTFPCGGALVYSFFLEGSGTAEYELPYVFRYFNDYNTDDIGCAYVLVEKNVVSEEETRVRITAIGFNVCVEGADVGHIDTPDFNDPTLLERRLSITYTL